MIVIQHEPGEGPGSLLPYLRDARIVRTFAADPVPQDCEALVVLGGGPVLGICLGSQLLAAALGAEVAKAEAKEIGFYRVRLTPQAREDALFATAPERFVAFHWHGDAFTLPRGAVPLASSTLTPQQAFRFGERAWGVQFHLETDEEVFSAMMAGEAELREAGVDPGHLRSQSVRELPRLRSIAHGVFARWAQLL